MATRRLLGLVGTMGALAACGSGDAVRGLVGPPSFTGFAAPVARLVPSSGDGTGSTVALATLGERRLALVADSDSRVVRLFDTKTDEEMPSTPLAGEPSQLVVATDGRVFVAVRDAAEVDVLEEVPGERPSLRIASRVSTALEPTGVALTPDGRTLLVACGWGKALDAFSTASLEHQFRTEVAREPRAVVTSADGRTAYVSHATASVVTAVDLMDPVHPVRPVRLEQPDFNGNEGRLAWRQGFTLARAEMGILAPGVTANTGDTTVRTETYGGVNETSMPAESFAMAAIDEPPALGAEAATAPRVKGAPETGCLLPRASAYDKDGGWLFVACQGDDKVWRLDAGARGSGRTASWSVGAAPTGIAIDAVHRFAFVWSQGARTVTSFPVDGFHQTAGSDQEQEGALVRTVAIGPRPGEATPADVGRALFHTTGDTRISSDGRACASCHPDGRDDGLVWATPDGPRQTPTLAGRLAGTAPYGWNGARSTVKQHVTNTLHRLGGTGLDDDAMNALVSYCMTMKPPPVAPPKDDLVAQGQDVFESASTGCSSCHIVDGTYTDGNRHDVKSRAKGDPARSFDTPSLRFLAGTAPYFHDGRYPTLRSLLIQSDGKMGHTAQLSTREMDALEAYLRAL